MHTSVVHIHAHVRMYSFVFACNKSTNVYKKKEKKSFGVNNKKLTFLQYMLMLICVQGMLNNPYTKVSLCQYTVRMHAKKSQNFCKR